MRAHGARHATAGGPWSRDVAAVGHVRAASLLIRLQEISAEKLGDLFRDKYFVARSEPIVEGIFARHVSGQGVGIAGANGGLQNRPNRIGVGMGGSGADLHEGQSGSALLMASI